MRESSLHCPKFLWRQKWFLLALAISITALIISTRYFKQPHPKRDTYYDDVDPEVYNEVLDRWYNFSGRPKWYNNENTSMYNDLLLAEIRDKWIIEKSTLSVSYVLQEPEIRDQSMGQAQAIMDIFENKKNGFFIECGAYDGETRSNTLVLERFFDWSGILIEADPINFIKMLRKNRRSRMSPTCLSVKSHPMNASFLMARNIGRIHELDNSSGDTSRNNMDVAHDGKHIFVQCFPLASYVAAMGIKIIDYLSLDVEGSEMEILETIPFDRLDIKALSVEYIHGKKGRRYMIDFMEKRGYYVYSFVTHSENLANDVIFVKKES